MSVLPTTLRLVTLMYRSPFLEGEEVSQNRPFEHEKRNQLELQAQQSPKLRETLKSRPLISASFALRSYFDGRKGENLMEEK